MRSGTLNIVGLKVEEVFHPLLKVLCSFFLVAPKLKVAHSVCEVGLDSPDAADLPPAEQHEVRHAVQCGAH